MKTARTLAALFLLCGACAVAAARQQQQSPPPRPNEEGDDEVERVNVDLVSLPVSVFDRDGRFVADLRREDFRVTDNGREQEVTYFATVEQPFSVLLLLDTSGSNQLSLEEMQQAAVRFVEQLRPQDRVLPVAFDNDLVPLLPDWTSDRARVASAIRATKTGMAVGPQHIEQRKTQSGQTYNVLRIGTRLYDSVGKAVAELSKVRGRKALILFTDGKDTASKDETDKSTLAEVEELDALVYAVRYGQQPRLVQNSQFVLGGRKEAEWRRAGEYLKRLAEKTGGLVYQAEDRKRIADAFTSIAEQLRLTYSIGYRPPEHARPGERREVRVKVTRQNVAVRARTDYVFKPTR